MDTFESAHIQTQRVHLLLLASMNSLSIHELHSLRLAIFDNAENLYKEAKLLHEYKMFSRAYLLAHFCFEEMGKIPIIVGAIGKKISGDSVDWKKIKNAFIVTQRKFHLKTITFTHLVWTSIY